MRERDRNMREKDKRGEEKYVYIATLQKKKECGSYQRFKYHTENETYLGKMWEFALLKEN